MMYALRHKETGELLRISVIGSDFCIGYESELIQHGDIIWVTSDFDLAEEVMKQPNSEWFNASLDSPYHDMVGKLEIVQLTVLLKRDC